MHRRLIAVLAILSAALPAAAAEPTAPSGAEQILSAAPNATSYDKHLLLLTEEPHMAGTERNLALAEYVRARFREYGLDEVSFHEFPALLSFGKSASLAIRSPVEQALNLREDPYPADKDSRLYDDPAHVAFHGYAPSGKVRAEVVYANGGSPEDFQQLDRMGLDLKGKIVLMRYSSPYSYRGYKVYEAEKRGAAGTIIYSDPAESGAMRGPVYPHGPWGPESAIEWGAVLYDWLGQGEPFTFHWQKQPDGRWSRRSTARQAAAAHPLDAAERAQRSRDPQVLAGTRGARRVAGRPAAQVPHRAGPRHARDGRAQR